MKYYDAILKMYSGYLNMPIDVIANSSSSHDNGKKFNTVHLYKNLFLRTNYIEPNIEEDIDMKKQNRIKNLPCLQEIQMLSVNHILKVV